MSKISSAIRRLNHSASNGDISALFQLYENHLYGDGVEEDEVIANTKLKQCAEFLSNPSNRIRLDTIGLTDFRKLTKLEIHFEKQLTVLIGDNAAGKTSIIDSIVKILSWVSAQIEKKSKTAKSIAYQDINVNSKHYSEISSVLSITEKAIYKANLSLPIKGASKTKKSSLSELSSIANLYRVTNDKYTIELPLFAAYSANRSSKDAQQTFQAESLSYQKEGSRFDAYDDALEGGIGNFNDFLKWFITLDNLAKQESQPQAIKLLEEINLLESLGDDKKISEIIEQKRQEYAELTASKVEQFITLRNTVETAIASLVPEITALNIDRSSGRAELKVKIQGQLININLLSDGQKVLTALAADLSRRLITLNPEMSKPLNSQGIVLIDEVELHLHPKWQQNILLNLQNTFPNIQFIVTTHSPQVLSVVDKACIRLIEENYDNGVTVTTPQYQTKGVMSSDILEQIMGTFATPQIREAIELQDLHALIAEDRYEEQEAQDLFKRLKKHFGTNHPEITSCHSQIRLQKLKALARSKSKDSQEK